MILGILLLSITSCKDFLKIDPPIDQIGTNKIYATDETATAAVRGLYATMMSASNFASGGPSSVTRLCALSADDLINYGSSQEQIQFYDSTLLPTNSSLRAGLWTEPYKIIYGCNAVIENLQISPNISADLKQQLEGEALFIRAFCFFYLTNLFGNVPIILSTDYRVNASSAANTKTEVYAQIVKDLQAAKAQLAPDYIGGNRTRANKWAATALLARTYLYMENWADAELQASEVIAQSAKYMINIDLNAVFLKNSNEAILQFFVPATRTVNTLEGAAYILTSAPGGTGDVALNNSLYAAFEPGDTRASKWTGTFTSGINSWRYIYKYKVKSGATPSTEYSMVLRLAEQYLIRAEARINQTGKLSQGIQDLNMIRSRARALPTVAVPNPLPDLSTSMLKADALLALEKERRMELFGEWGHRWLDLKRFNRATAVLAPVKGINWQATDVLYPIPSAEILNNPKLVQNPGYN